MTTLPLVDLQVNGYAGVDFNAPDLAAADLHRACARLEADGITACLPTIITDDVERMCRKLTRLASLREEDALARRIIAGLNIEGPFISPEPGYCGAHPADAVRPADVDTARRLLDAGAGLVRIVTLAPECDPGLAVTRMLADAGVLVAAGHTDASLSCLERAIDAGLSMFTHVGNGCPMHLHRHDNIVQRAPALADRLWLTFIADGVHVPFVALRNYLRLADPDRTIVVSDAVAPAGLGPGRYTLGAQPVVVGDDMVARAADGSHFIGSAATLGEAASRLRDRAGLDHETVVRLT
jgi:N-acetylglucosamine-6-phosphate deacetylase